MGKGKDSFSIINFFENITTKQATWIIVILGFAVYFNSLFNGFIGDDYAQIVSNSIVHNIGNIGKFFLNSTFGDNSFGLTGIYYKPILTTSYSLIYTFFKTLPLPYHLFQLTIHISNSLLIFLLLKKFFGKDVAFFISLIFLIHPINNEAVVSIAALQEPLFLLFGLSALLLIEQKSVIKNNIALIFLLLFSLLSKETGVPFLIVVPIFSILFKKKWKPALVQSGIAFLLYLFLRVGIARIYFAQDSVFKYSMTQLDFAHRMINIPAIFSFYIKTFIYPRNLLVNQRWIVSTLNFQDFYLPLLIAVIFIGLLILGGYYLHKNVPKIFNIYLFFFIWFVLGISLHFQIIPLDYTVADRWFYFPIIGLLGLCATLITPIRRGRRLKVYFYTILLLLICAYSVRDIVRNRNWSNAYTLYVHDIKDQEGNYSLQSSLGIELYNQEKYEKAKEHLLTSIELYPNNQNWSALGFVYVKLDNYPEAKKSFHNALSYKDNPLTYQTLIKIMLVHDTPEETTSFIKEELKNNPDDSVLWLYLAVEDYKIGKKDEALLEVQKSYDIYPSNEAQYIYQQIMNNQPINIISND